MTTALIYFAVSTSVVLVLTTLYLVEDRYGRRVVLVGARNWLDRSFQSVYDRLAHWFERAWAGLVRFVLHYGVRVFLATVAYWFRYWEKRVENVIRRNRQSLRRERTGRNHLDDIADHKQSTALSEEKKQQMRDG